MDRREFLRMLGAGSMVAVVPSVMGGCAMVPIRPDGSPETRPLDAILKAGARVMWCAPHPDDECFPGSVLARSSIHYGNPLHFMILTHGDGGECCRPEGCEPDLATVRAEEMRRVAERYRGELRHERFYNAPLPVESFPKRHEMFARWNEQGDPIGIVARAMRRFRPDVVLTFQPDWGATGHPEHQLTARIAGAAIRQAADDGVQLDGLAAHRVDRFYYFVNHLWLMRLIGRADPGPVTETFDATLPCTRTGSCLDFMTEATRFHLSQDRDMGNVRRFRSAFRLLYLCQVDPFTQIADPAEVRTSGRMM